jgi:hypothetical protein
MKRFLAAGRRVLLPVLIGLVARAGCADDAETNSLSKTSELAHAGSIINLPGLIVHGGDHKFIEATGHVALTDGILEFIAVEPTGRDYESLLTLDCKPSELQFALILIGGESGLLPQQAKAGEKVGDRLQLEVEWETDGKNKRVPAEKLLRDRRTKKAPVDIPWIFTGSYFTKNFDGHDVFMADQEQAFIALWWSPSALINVGGEYGNPYRGENQGLEIDQSAVPPKGALVKMILRKSGQ